MMDQVLPWRSQYADWMAQKGMDNCPYSRSNMDREKGVSRSINRDCVV